MSADPAPDAEIEVFRNWDGQLWQTADLQPSAASAALISFRCDEDGSVPAPIASALAHALSTAGFVLGRWFEDPPTSDDATYLAAPGCGLLRRVAERLAHSEPVDLVITRSPDVSARFFDQAWGLQYQFLTVLEPDMGSRFGPAIEAVRTRRVWSDFPVGAPILATVAPAVDGNGALVATASETQLARILALVEREAATRRIRWIPRRSPARPAAAE